MYETAAVALFGAHAGVMLVLLSLMLYVARTCTGIRISYLVAGPLSIRWNSGIF